MLSELPFDVLLEWRAFDQIEPFGGVRADWQAAGITAGISNVIAASVRSRHRFKVEDFLLKFRTPEETKAALEAAKGSPVDWQRMKFIARIAAATANADEEKKSEREKRRDARRAAREETAALAKAKRSASENLEAVRAALMKPRG